MKLKFTKISHFDFSHTVLQQKNLLPRMMSFSSSKSNRIAVEIPEVSNGGIYLFFYSLFSVVLLFIYLQNANFLATHVLYYTVWRIQWWDCWPKFRWWRTEKEVVNAKLKSVRDNLKSSTIAVEHRTERSAGSHHIRPIHTRSFYSAASQRVQNWVASLFCMKTFIICILFLLKFSLNGAR